MKRSTSYLDENGLPLWAPRVSKRSIAELYRNDAHGGGPITTDGRWCDRADLAQLSFAIPQHQALAQQCLEEVEGIADPDLRSRERPYLTR